jgi:hypothetical protein
VSISNGCIPKVVITGAATLLPTKPQVTADCIDRICFIGIVVPRFFRKRKHQNISVQIAARQKEFALSH